MGILKAMQSPSHESWSKYIQKHQQKIEEEKQAQEERDEKFYRGLRERREKSKAEFQEKRRLDQERLRAETKPLKPLPELPPALIKGELISPSTPALINPEPREEKAPGAEAGGIFGFGIFPLLRRRS